MDKQNKRIKPDWLKTKLPLGTNYATLKKIVSDNDLHTICSSGKCPNMGECWNRGTATFMILGDICTRSCKFCATLTGKPLAPDVNEPAKVAESIRLMKLQHCVITSVDRDDLPDFGADHWVQTIRAIKAANPDTTIEVLIPDFQGKADLINLIIAEHPEVISHNLETVRRLTPFIRSKASYALSLNVIPILATGNVVPKSGIMVGLGETLDEIYETMDDLLEAGCKVMTIGQYLQPTRKHQEVKRYVHPDEFALYREEGLKRGFEFVESSPLVRSSYCAEKHVNNYPP